MILTNALLVLEDRVVHGHVEIDGETIARIGDGPAEGLDLQGDLLIPGLIELHTDNLERHLRPRPGVDWPRDAAILAHDAELAGVGITTVFDAMRIGSMTDSAHNYGPYARPLATEILRLRDAGVLRISHFLHLRAEICTPTLLDEFADFGPEDRIGIVSLMDHTPGQRQFRDIDKFRQYLTGKEGYTAEGAEAHFAHKIRLQKELGPSNEAAAVAEARRLGATLASHDDTTAAHVAVSAGHGARIAEFPTTMEAAAASHAAGIAVMMGAPNLLRGKSHSGNVAAAEVATAGHLDVLSSDYAPAALLMGALKLADQWSDLARGIATVTAAPARAAGLSDRGRLAEGLRADLVRVRRVGAAARTAGVWVRGARVA